MFSVAILKTENYFIDSNSPDSRTTLKPLILDRNYIDGTILMALKELLADYVQTTSIQTWDEAPEVEVRQSSSQE